MEFSGRGIWRNDHLVPWLVRSPDSKDIKDSIDCTPLINIYDFKRRITEKIANINVDTQIERPLSKRCYIESLRIFSYNAQKLFFFHNSDKR